MKTMFADESGIAWDETIGFFIYGGIILDEETIQYLNKSVIEVKKKYRIESDWPLKWNNKKWKGKTLDRETHRLMKEEILNLFSLTSAKIIICLSPHRFYHDSTLDIEGNIVMRINPATLYRTHKYAMNDLLKKFEQFLGNEQGLVIADKFGSAVAADLTKHCINSFPYNKFTGQGNIINRVIQIPEEECEPLQVTDIVLGSIQCSLKDSNTFNFLPIIKNNFWSNRTESKNIVSGYGFNIYPIAARYDTYQKAKEKLIIKFRKEINT